MTVASGKGDGLLLGVTEVGFVIPFRRGLFLKERKESGGVGGTLATVSCFPNTVLMLARPLS